jgi:structural maintenance of chromosomes protein 5
MQDLVNKIIQDQSELAVISLKQIQLTANVHAIDELCSSQTMDAKCIRQAYNEGV